jgi:hypothetical protein
MASFDGAVQSERALLASLIEAPDLWGQTDDLTTDDFLLSDHRRLWQALLRMHEDGIPVDLLALAGEVDPAVLADVMGGGHLAVNFKRYARAVREGARDRDFQRVHERLGSADHEDRLALLDELRCLLEERPSEDWRRLFHTWDEFERAEPLCFAIDGFLQEAGVTLIGGLAGHGKTLIMLSMVKALLEETPLFGHKPFSVSRSATRVCYLIPESSIGPFWTRVKLFRLEQYVKEDRLLIRTLSSPEQVELTDPRILKVAEDADIFLDSVVRFTIGNENDAENIRQFSDVMFRLLQSGARTITGCHHSPKSFESAQSMSLENILRGSGDLGAMISTCWGIRQIDAARNRIYVESVKARDFQPCPPFILEGRPHLDVTGQVAMHARPGEAEDLRSYLQQKSGRPLAPDRAEQTAMAVSLRAKGHSLREIASKMNLGKSTVSRMLDDYDLSEHDPDEEGRKPQ